jgi:hypothetical protein
MADFKAPEFIDDTMYNTWMHEVNEEGQYMPFRFYMFPNLESGN